MIDFLIHAVLTALVILGANLTTDAGMILEHPAAWLMARLPLWLIKPLFLCPFCMASIWGVASFFTFYPDALSALPLLPVFILTVCGAVQVLHKD